jgi:Transposase DDE domain
MRSKFSHKVTDRDVQAVAQRRLSQALKLKGSGWKCTPDVIWQVVLLAAAKAISLFAACRDLAHAPCDNSVRGALANGLPARCQTLERRLAAALCQDLPRVVRRRAWELAIDYHLIPYHGEPRRCSNELYRSKPKSGTTKFHCYATAQIVVKGHRYTLAATYVLQSHSLVQVLSLLLDRIADRGIAVKTLLLDAQFCNVPVIELLQSRKLPFLMPLAMRGRKAKPGKRATGMRAYRRKKAGRYTFTWKVGKQSPVTFQIVVAYKTHAHPRTENRCNKKYLYAAWNVGGAPKQIREQYRSRFAIESSYRQMRQARIRTCSTDPLLRLFFVLVALILRNIWAWLHYTCFAEQRHSREPQMNLQCLRFQRTLNWIANSIIRQLHDGSEFQVPSRNRPTT